tara:strand:+ start:1003 stop:1212 length:210 start_codon:yes stop_codon:yes gene_type:complete
MTKENNSDANIDTIELCKKIEHEISRYSKKNTSESVRLVNEVLRPSLFCIKLNETILKELSQIGSKHFT